VVEPFSFLSIKIKIPILDALTPYLYLSFSLSLSFSFSPFAQMSTVGPKKVDKLSEKRKRIAKAQSNSNGLKWRQAQIEKERKKEREREILKWSPDAAKLKPYVFLPLQQSTFLHKKAEVTNSRNVQQFFFCLLDMALINFEKRIENANESASYYLIVIVIWKARKIIAVKSPD
jgi:hypothetical protein